MYVYLSVGTFVGPCTCITCVCISVHLFVGCVSVLVGGVLRVCLHVSVCARMSVACVYLCMHASVLCVSMHLCVSACLLPLQGRSPGEDPLQRCCLLYPGTLHFSPDRRMPPGRQVSPCPAEPENPSALAVFCKHSKNFSCK